VFRRGKLITPPNTAADMAHSTYSTQPALRPHRAGMWIGRCMYVDACMYMYPTSEDLPIFLFKA